MTGNKLFQIISILLLVSMCLCGCQKENTEEKKEELAETVQEENPFDLDSMKQNGQNIQASFSFGVHNYDEDRSQIPYNGGELQVDFEVSPQDCSFDCSVLIYIDGILQKYALEPLGKVSEQHTVKVENQTTIISTYFSPQIDADRKKHFMHFLCMYDPEFEPEEGSTSYGNSHGVSQVMPWELVVDGKCEKSEDTIILEKMELVPEEKRKEYESNTENDTRGNRLDTGIRYEVANGKKGGEITFRVLGGLSGKYRLSAYVEHKLVDFSNGAKYIDLSLDGKHMYEGDVNVGELTGKGYGTLYLIAIPISNFGTAMVEKSNSMCLYHGGIQDDTN